MSPEDFLAGLTGSRDDFRLAAQALRAAGRPFCLIGGLAVNHYVEPVVTLDADFAVAGEEGVIEALRSVEFEVERHQHSINARFPGSHARLADNAQVLRLFPAQHLAPPPVVQMHDPIADVLDSQSSADRIIKAANQELVVRFRAANGERDFVNPSCKDPASG